TIQAQSGLTALRLGFSGSYSPGTGSSWQMAEVALGMNSLTVVGAGDVTSVASSSSARFWFPAGAFDEQRLESSPTTPDIWLTYMSESFSSEQAAWTHL